VNEADETLAEREELDYTELLLDVGNEIDSIDEDGDEYEYAVGMTELARLIEINAIEPLLDVPDEVERIGDDKDDDLAFLQTPGSVEL
jgi:hypothetical protein